MDIAKFVGYLGFYADQLGDVVQLLISLVILGIALQAYRIIKQISDAKKNLEK